MQEPLILHIPSANDYHIHSKPMPPTTRKNYIKDRTQVAITYIAEYNNTKLWELENKVPVEKLTQRLQIVYGRTNAVREVIDQAIEADDSVRRRSALRYVEAPKKDSQPQTRWTGTNHLGGSPGCRRKHKY